MKKKKVSNTRKTKRTLRAASKRSSAKKTARVTKKRVSKPKVKKRSISEAMRHDSHKRYQHKYGEYCFECEHHPDDHKEKLEEHFRKLHVQKN